MFVFIRSQFGPSIHLNGLFPNLALAPLLRLAISRGTVFLAHFFSRWAACTRDCFGCLVYTSPALFPAPSCNRLALVHWRVVAPFAWIYRAVVGIVEKSNTKQNNKKILVVNVKFTV